MSTAVVWPLLLIAGVAYGHFQCDPADCICNTDDTADRYEVDCPKSNLYLPVALLKIQFIPKVSVTFVCTTTAVDYSWLQGLEIEQVPLVSFIGCPLPEPSIGHILSSLDITNISTLIFQSNMKLENALKNNHLHGLNSTNTLILSLNGLTELPKGIFGSMHNLKSLILKSNNVHLTLDTFYDASNLVSLDLGTNNLSNVKADIFGHLSKLTELNLSGNNLKNVTKRMFTGLNNLMCLDLSFNHISSPSEDAISYLTKIKNLSLASNVLLTLPKRFFHQNPSLEVIKLKDNKKLSIIPEGLLANLTTLKEVDFQNCSISHLPENLLWGSKHVSIIQLSNNIITDLPQFLFKNTINLHKLYLSHNKLTILPESLYAPLSQLNILNLDHNFITIVTRSMLQGLERLTELNLNNNNIHYIHPDAFQSTRNLKVLHLAHNHISFISRTEMYARSPMHYCTQLRELHLDHNQVATILPDWQLHTNLQKLNLSYNAITKLEFQNIQMKSRRIIVDLSSNQIKSIDLSKAEQVVQGKKFSEVVNVNIKLHKNPLQCDCQIYDLLRYLEFKIAPEVHAAVNLDLGNLTCASPPEMADLPVNKLKSHTLVCPMKEQCPEQCLCLLHREDRVLIVNCSGLELREAPANLPSHQVISNIELYLDQNMLKNLPCTLTSTYSKVSKLSLSHNSIREIRNSSLPQNLQILRVDNNSLTHLDDSTMNSFKRLNTIALENNPWNCNCEQLNLVKFLLEYPQKVENLGGLKCAGEQGDFLRNLSERDLCSSLHWEVVVASIVAIALAATVLGLLALLYLNYQQKIRTRLYAYKR